jgi:hypothetical protein
VTPGEFGGNLFEKRADAVLWQRHDPADDPAYAFRIARIETAQENARLVRF